MRDEELRLLIETEVAIHSLNSQVMYESGSKDTKSVISKIMDKIKEFLKTLIKNIQAWYTERGIKKKIRTLKNLMDKDPTFAAKYIPPNIKMYDLYGLQANYEKYISSLKKLNYELPEDVSSEELDKYTSKIALTHELYEQKFMSILGETEGGYDAYTRVVGYMTKFANNIMDHVEEAEDLLSSIQRDGIKSFPDAKNAYIGKAFAKASVYYSKLATVAEKQLGTMLSKVDEINQ